MKRNRYVYAGAQLAVIALVVWLASSAAAPLGTLAQALIGVALTLGGALVTTAVTLALREARDHVAEMVAHELSRHDSDASVTALADAVRAAPVQSAPGRHRAAEDPERTEPEDTQPALFTHEQLFGAITGDM